MSEGSQTVMKPSKTSETTIRGMILRLIGDKLDVFTPFKRGKKGKREHPRFLNVHESELDDPVNQLLA